MDGPRLSLSAALTALALALASPPTLAQVTWTEVVSGGQGLANSAMAYDAARGRLIRYGGGNSGGLSDTTAWWDGSRWIELSPTTNPGLRSNHTMAYDSARGRIVLYGGGSSTETWEWDGAGWVLATPPTNPGDALRLRDGVRRGPSPHRALRWRETSARPAKRGSTTAHRGAGVSPPSARRRAPSTPWPTTRLAGVSCCSEAASAACAATRGSTTARRGRASPRPWRRRPASARRWSTTPLWAGSFCSVGTTANTYPEETWAWDGANWEQLAQTESPQGRRDGAAAYDAQRQEIVVSGGSILNSGLTWLGDTWSWNTASGWTVLGSSAKPIGTVDHAMAFDAARSRVVLFGGSSEPFVRAYRDETWAVERQRLGTPATDSPAVHASQDGHGVRRRPRACAPVRWLGGRGAAPR